MTAQRRIEVVEYDPSWPRQFAREAATLESTFNSSHVASHHIGSTSVPGLAAKPTIDIAIEVTGDTDIPHYYPMMERIGYTCRGECLDAVIPGVPGRYYFVRYDGDVHLVHVHVYRTGHGDLEEKLLFRDYLRAHPWVAAEYGELKRALATTNRYDNIGYMRGKDDFVKQVIEAAAVWRIQNPSRYPDA